MTPPDDSAWAGRLRPLILGADAPLLADQLRTRLGITLVASALLGAMGAFFLVIFAGFGQARLGVGVASVVVVPLWPIWERYGRLRRAVAAHDRSNQVVRGPRGRIDAGPTSLG